MTGARNSTGIEPGQRLTFVAHLEGMPYSEQVAVLETEPFVVEAHASWCRLLRRGARVVLLRPVEGDFAKSELAIVSIQKYRNTYRIGFEAPSWRESDRRKYPRFEASVPVQLRRVSEEEGIIHIHADLAFTMDVSAGGAWLISNTDTPEGTVVQVEIDFHGHPCRALGVVVRNEPGREGFAVEFLDFVGSSRYALTEFLRQAA